MLAKDVREMTEAEINAKIAELERERFNLRVRGGTQTLEDPLRLRVLRKDIARLNTILGEKIIGIAEANAPAKKPAARRVTGRRGRKRATAASRSKKRA
jgi:large subunit ribosomal protein L29